MTNTQLYLAIGVPILTNAAMLGLLLAYINARFDAVSARFDAVNSRFDGINARFEHQDQLFTEKLRRVEEVLDAHLRLIEDKLNIR